MSQVASQTIVLATHFLFDTYAHAHHKDRRNFAKWCDRLRTIYASNIPGR